MEISSYLILLTGVSLDQITTKIGVSAYNLHEANIITLRLMELGIWSYLDYIISLGLVAVIYISHRSLRLGNSKFLFLFPTFSGIIRFSAGLLNLSLF